MQQCGCAASFKFRGSSKAERSVGKVLSQKMIVGLILCQPNRGKFIELTGSNCSVEMNVY